jgi:hypothetical protein
MSFDKDTLFNLLPAFDRIRDHNLVNSSPDGTEEGPMKALLELLAEQVAVLEENLEQLYDDQFIETCAEWVVPYIGQLVGTRGLIVFPDAPFSQRGQVANTITYRRRKGTAAVLEQLAHDVTGWDANVVEYFQLLATSQYLNHLRPGNLSMADLRNWESMEYVNTPFDKLTRTADVRRIETKRGKYNIHNIGIFLWRIGAYSSIKSPAYKVDSRRYKFDPLGKDIQLYNMPVTETEISHLADPVNVPMPLRRLVMRKYTERYYGAEKSVLIYKDGVAIDPLQENPPLQDLSAMISICNLSDTTDGTGNWCNMPDNKIAIDPVLGRIAFPALQPAPSRVHVNYHYGFSDKMSGGDYGRTESFSTDLEEINKIRVPEDKATIQEALTELENTGGVVEVTNNEYYFETPVINIAEGKKIELRSADAMRPILVLSGDVLIFGGSNSEVLINGLLISGGCLRLPSSDLTGAVNQLKSLEVHHSTLLPGSSPAFRSVPSQPAQPRLIVEMPGVKVTIDKCITGAIRSNEEAVIQITDSIVDAVDDKEIAYAGLNTNYGAPLNVKNTTFIGRVITRIMELASNTIFHTRLGWMPGDAPPVEAQRLQEGCVRFCYIPIGSRLPKRYNCQPENEADAARLRPLFNSLKYGEAAYCQLSQHCAKEITQGADNESEMGAFNNLYQPQREINLRTRLNEYMRFGLEAGIFYGS